MDDVDTAAALRPEPRGGIRILCAQECGPADYRDLRFARFRAAQRSREFGTRDARANALADLAGPLNLD